MGSVSCTRGLTLVDKVIEVELSIGEKVLLWTSASVVTSQIGLLLDLFVMVNQSELSDWLI